MSTNHYLAIVKSATVTMVILCVLSICVSSCNGTDTQKIATAMDVVEERPDSAYLILKNVDYNSLSGEKEQAGYIYTHALANLYLNRSLLTDSLLPLSIEYFKANKDTARYIKACIA